jgi:hypothetical protein
LSRSPIVGSYARFRPDCRQLGNYDAAGQLMLNRHFTH